MSYFIILAKFTSSDGCQYQLLNTFGVFFSNEALWGISKLIIGKVRNAMRLVGTLKFKVDSLVANCGFFVNL